MIDHIERNTNPIQRSKTKYENIEPEPEGQQIDFMSGDKKDDEESGMKQTERQKTLEEMRRKSNSTGKFTVDGKKVFNISITLVANQ